MIVTWNSGPDLATCLAALPSFVRPIVVDNGSADDGVAIARAAGVDVIALGENRGFPAAVNVGLERVTSDFTLLLNPDLVVGEGAVERCVAVIGGRRLHRPGRPEHGRLGLGTPNPLPPGGTGGPATSCSNRSPSPACTRGSTGRRSATGAEDRDVDAVNGAFMLVRTDLLRSLGGLDETVFMYLEDADLCRRVRDAGYRVRFIAGATAVHAGATSTSRGDTDAQARAYLHRLDADIEFLRRYGRRGEAGLGVAAYLLRSVVGLVVSTRMKDRRQRYASALRWTWSQRRGRTQPPAGDPATSVTASIWRSAGR